MPHEISNIDVEKNHIVYNLFVDTADQNYVVARWCFQNALHLDYFWNGAHALEKYMKAALLLNGRSSIKPAEGGKPFGHDLERLYGEVQSIAGDILPEMLIKPNEVRMQHWRGESVADFMRRFSEGGDAHNRYAIFGYVQHKEDLYKLDRVVFAVRRSCCPLDAYFFGNVRYGQPTCSFRDRLKRDPDYMPHMAGSRLAKLAGKKASEEIQRAALNHNLMFAADDYQHGTLRTGTAAANPVLGRILDAASQGVSGQHASDTIQVLDWVLGNIFLPPAVEKQLTDARAKLAGRP